MKKNIDCSFTLFSVCLYVVLTYYKDLVSYELYFVRCTYFKQVFNLKYGENNPEIYGEAKSKVLKIPNILFRLHY